MAAKPHECRRPRTCCCSIQGLEPDEDCPIHGWPWPPKCEECGRFIPWVNNNPLYPPPIAEAT